MTTWTEGDAGPARTPVLDPPSGYIARMDAKSPPRRPPVVLCVLDGWGCRPPADDNAISRANAPVYRRLLADCPSSTLISYGNDVGLPAGQMGNSEVGHLNLGAGRVVNQDIQRIEAAVQDGSLARNPALGGLIDRLKATRGTCHVLGLISPGGVHSHQDQIASLLRTVAQAGVAVAVHAFLDGRDTPPQSARDYVRKFQADIAGTNARIVTVIGRFYAMDRDKRWERVERAYDALTRAHGEHAPDPIAAIEAGYARNETDEFVSPTIINGYTGMADGDAVLCGNFRADRVREILSALLDPAFAGFKRAKTVRLAAAVGVTEYSSELAKLMAALFPPIVLKRILSEVVADAGLQQLRIAETEKYAHVTYFFNGGREAPFTGEDRILVPSPKVKTYDEKPEMSAAEVTDKLVEQVRSGKYGFILVNFANPDMVGHTGNLAAAIQAIEAVDRCLGRLEAAVKDASGMLLITADHGNAEQMYDPQTHGPHTAHTVGKVPAILVNAPGVRGLEDGRLADVAPTLLALMGLPQPAEMTGRSLLAGAKVRAAAT